MDLDEATETLNLLTSGSKDSSFIYVLPLEETDPIFETQESCQEQEFLRNDEPESTNENNQRQENVNKTEDKTEVKYGSFVCPICNAFFSRSNAFYGHLQTHSGKGTLFDCQDCGKTFESLAKLWSHEKIHSNYRPFCCKHCSKSFERQSQLNSHIQRIHEEKKPHSCKYCSKSFYKISDMKQHESVHLGEKRFACSECGKTFNHISNCNRHVRTHTKEKPYVCDICHRRFNQLSSLNSHKSRHKIGASTPDLNCPHCKTCFENESQLELHLKEEHSGAIPKLFPKDRNFHCRVCGLRFGFVSQLKSHIIIAHDKESNINFKTGNKTTLQSGDLILEQTCDTDATENNIEIEEISTSDELVLIDGDIDSCHPSSVDAQHKLETSVGQGKIRDPTILELHDGTSEILIEIVDHLNEVERSDSSKIKNFQDCLRETGNDQDHTESYARSRTSTFASESGTRSPRTSESVLSKVTTNQTGLLNNSTSQRSPQYTRTKILDKTSSLLNTSTSETGLPNTNEGGLPNTKSTKRSFKFICDVCQKFFPRKVNLVQHMGLHSEKMAAFACDQCDIKFAWKTTLRKHKIREHQTESWPEISCDLCQRTFKSTSHKKKHILRDHLKERNFRCEICQKCFFLEGDLKTHLRTHTTQRPFACSKCPKAFRHISHKIKHQKTHIANEAFSCELCQKGFSKKIGLLNHFRKIHPDLNIQHVENLLNVNPV